MEGFYCQVTTMMNLDLIQSRKMLLQEEEYPNAITD